MLSGEVVPSAVMFVEEGREVILPVDGKSMLPFIVGGIDSVALYKPGTLRKGDIVLAYTQEKGYVIHRIDSIGGDGIVALLGDGNLAQREHCQLADIKAIATHVIKPNGKRKPLNEGWLRFAGRVWRLLLPVRRYLLWIYKKTHGIK
jgi:hypothetical protein